MFSMVKKQNRSKRKAKLKQTGSKIKFAYFTDEAKADLLTVCIVNIYADV